MTHQIWGKNACLHETVTSSADSRTTRHFRIKSSVAAAAEEGTDTQKTLEVSAPVATVWSVLFPPPPPPRFGDCEKNSTQYFFYFDGKVQPFRFSRIQLYIKSLLFWIPFFTVVTMLHNFFFPKKHSSNEKRKIGRSCFSSSLFWIIWREQKNIANGNFWSQKTAPKKMRSNYDSQKIVCRFFCRYDIFLLS